MLTKKWLWKVKFKYHTNKLISCVYVMGLVNLLKNSYIKFRLLNSLYHIQNSYWLRWINYLDCVNKPYLIESKISFALKHSHIFRWCLGLKLMFLSVYVNLVRITLMYICQKRPINRSPKINGKIQATDKNELKFTPLYESVSVCTH